MYGTAIAICAGLMIGNFVWQAFTKREWGTAIERSFFQAAALGTFLLATASH